MKLATFKVPTPAMPLRRIGAAVDGKLVDFAAAYAAHLENTDPGCDAQRLAGLLFPSDIRVLVAGEVRAVREGTAVLFPQGAVHMLHNYGIRVFSQTR